MNLYSVRNTKIVRKTPKVLSKMFVLKYQLQAQVDIFVDKSREIMTFMKWAKVCEIPCLDVSKAQIFHGRFGSSVYRLYIRTLNDMKANTIWIMTPAKPKI
jgi:hypothetical protein